MRRRLRIAIAALAACLLLAVPAAAATIVGSQLTAEPEQAPFECLPSTNCIFLIDTLAQGTSAIPSAGVVTAFHAKVRSYANLRFRIDRGTLAFHVPATSVYRSPLAVYYTVPGNGTQVFTEPVRIPVQAGDRVAVDGSTGNWVATVPGSRTLVGVADNSGFFSWGGGTKVNFEVLVNAVVEPDGDGDSYGDETQDCAPLDPARHDGCTPGGRSPPPAPGAPLVPRIVIPRRTPVRLIDRDELVVPTRCELPAGSATRCSGAHVTYAGVGPAALGGVLSNGPTLGRPFGFAARRALRLDLKVGSARFDIAAGAQRDVKIPLNRRARRTLAQRGKITILLVTTVRIRAGKVAVTRRTLTLHAPARRRSHR